MSKGIRINVDTSQAAAAFEEPGKNQGNGVTELFFEDQLAKATEHLKQLANGDGPSCSPHDEPPVDLPEKPPLTLFGGRGAGKTSFLKTLRSRLKHDPALKELRAVVLDTLEPNRIEDNEIFFVSVVENIIRQVRQKNKLRSNYRDSADLERFETACRELAQTFDVLQQNHGFRERGSEESSTAFAERALQSSDSGLEVRARFAVFVREAARFCECGCFVLCIDDADVSHHRCTEVLETVRKYLGVPKLVVVIAADEDLLDLHLTAQAWEWMEDLVNLETQTGSAETRKSARNLRTYRHQAYSLKEQYLTKTLPPRYRVVLKPLSRRIRDGEVQVELASSSQPSPVPLERLLEPLGGLLGSDWKSAAQFLPQNSRSLVRLCGLLWSVHHEQKKILDESQAHGTRVDHRDAAHHEQILDELQELIRVARKDMGVRGQMLRELRAGNGDLRLMRWVIHQTVDTPRSFTLTGDPAACGDDRQLVPLLIHACWSHGCATEGRVEGFLSYGLRVVLPAYCVERASDRNATAAELEYKLKSTEEQSCATTVGRLLAWWDSRNVVAGSDSQSHRGPVEPTLCEIRVKAPADEGPNWDAAWYRQIGERPSSFLMGLARVADLCEKVGHAKEKGAEMLEAYIKSLAIATRDAAVSDLEGQWIKISGQLSADAEQKLDRIRCSETPEPPEFKELGMESRDFLSGSLGSLTKILEKTESYISGQVKAWFQWLNRNPLSSEPPEPPHKVLPARLVGEIFVFIYNQSQERVFENASVRDYIRSFWYALASWEVAWRRDEPWPIQPRGTYGAVSPADLNRIFSESKDLSHTQFWMRCPLFAGELEYLRKVCPALEQQLPAEQT